MIIKHKSFNNKINKFGYRHFCIWRRTYTNAKLQTKIFYQSASTNIYIIASFTFFLKVPSFYLVLFICQNTNWQISLFHFAEKLFKENQYSGTSTYECIHIRVFQDTSKNLRKIMPHNMSIFPKYKQPAAAAVPTIISAQQQSSNPHICTLYHYSWPLNICSDFYLCFFHILCYFFLLFFCAFNHGVQERKC